MSKELDTTFYRFQSEVRAFLAKLLKNPVDAQPSKYLKDREFTRKKLINELLSRDVIERHEKILDRTNSEEKDAKYVVKFKIHKKDFEKRLHRMYIKFFEKNLNESVEEMQAWHGSMNSFDAFDEDHVDDGAGAQLKGWGTYVATDRVTGEKYCQRFNNSTNQTYLYEVQIPEDNGNNYLNFEGNKPEVYDWIYKVLAKAYPKCKSYLQARIQNCKENDDLEGICYSLPGLPVDEISKTLDRNGIVGIRYKNSNGGLNYCVFRAANVRIVNRSQYGMNESVFENEEEMKKQILNGPDGDVYRKRGGINEEGEGGGMAAGGDGSGGATSTSSVASETTRGDLGYDVPFGQVQRRGIYVGAQGEKRSTNPILGKTITAEAKKGRRIYITEEQYQRILEEEGLGGATTTFSVGAETTRGDMGYDAPFPGKGKKKNKFLGPALDRTPGGICINQMDDETKKRK